MEYCHVFVVLEKYVDIEVIYRINIPLKFEGNLFHAPQIQVFIKVPKIDGDKALSTFVDG